MTPLRAKYIRDLTIRGRAERTQRAYTRYVSELERYYQRSREQFLRSNPAETTSYEQRCFDSRETISIGNRKTPRLRLSLSSRNKAPKVFFFSGSFSA